MSMADKGARNPMAHLCTHIYPCGNGKVQIPAGTSEDFHVTVMITNSRTSCGGSPGLQMGSKPGSCVFVEADRKVQCGVM